MRNEQRTRRPTAANHPSTGFIGARLVIRRIFFVFVFFRFILFFIFSLVLYFFLFFDFRFFLC